MTRNPFADELSEEISAKPAPKPSGMTVEQLMRLERRIDVLKTRGNEGENVGEQLRELRGEHYRDNGASGG